jgi:hypothetical protein
MTHENKQKKNESSKGIVNYESSLEMYSKSVKPNKGDKTPKSNESSFTNKDLECEVLEDEFNSSISVEGILPDDDMVNRFKNRIQTKGKDMVICVENRRDSKGSRGSKNTSLIKSPKYSKYDTTQIAYEANTEYTRSKKPSVDNNFLDRMNQDIGKRKEKEKKVNEMVDFRKTKITESARIRTFNGLIDDANRRVEAKEHIEKGHNVRPPKMLKNYSQKDWDRIYNNRFLNYKNHKDSRLEEKIIANEKLKKSNEDRMIEEMNSRVKKVPTKHIESHVNKLYKDAEKRRLSQQNKIEERLFYENRHVIEEGKSMDKFKSFSPVSMTF